MLRQRYPGSLAALLGSVGGALLLGSFGLELGDWYVRRYMPNAELGAVVPVGLGLLVGTWSGAVLGCWLALRVRRATAAVLTAMILGVLFPVGVYGWLNTSAHFVELSWRLASGVGWLAGATLLARLLTPRDG